MDDQLVSGMGFGLLAQPDHHDSLQAESLEEIVVGQLYERVGPGWHCYSRMRVLEAPYQRSDGSWWVLCQEISSGKDPEEKSLTDLGVVPFIPESSKGQWSSFNYMRRVSA